MESHGVPALRHSHAGHWRHRSDVGQRGNLRSLPEEAAADRTHACGIPLRFSARSPAAALQVPSRPRRRPLARAFELPILQHALQRVRDTAPQAGLNALARRRNPRGAFTIGRDLRNRARIPAHVALVDDVMTTGATLYACAKALQRAGVARVDVWVMARVPPPR